MGPPPSCWSLAAESTTGTSEKTHSPQTGPDLCCGLWGKACKWKEWLCSSWDRCRCLNGEGIRREWGAGRQGGSDHTDTEPHHGRSRPYSQECWSPSHHRTNTLEFMVRASERKGEPHTLPELPVVGFDGQGPRVSAWRRRHMSGEQVSLWASTTFIKASSWLWEFLLSFVPNSLLPSLCGL